MTLCTNVISFVLLDRDCSRTNLLIRLHHISVCVCTYYYYQSLAYDNSPPFMYYSNLQYLMCASLFLAGSLSTMKSRSCLSYGWCCPLQKYVCSGYHNNYLLLHSRKFSRCPLLHIHVHYIMGMIAHINKPTKWWRSPIQTLQRYPTTHVYSRMDFNIIMVYILQYSLRHLWSLHVLSYRWI